MSDIPILTFNNEKTQISLLEQINDSVVIIQNSILNKLITNQAKQTHLLDAQGKKIEKSEKIINKKDDELKKEEIQETKKRSVFLDKMLDNLKTVNEESITALNTTKDTLIQGIAGPFKLLTDPIKQLTGFDILGKFSEITKIKPKTSSKTNSLAKIKSKKIPIKKIKEENNSTLKIKPKINPTKKDLSLTESGQAILYAENVKQKTKKDKDSDSKILGFLPAGFKNIGKVLLKALPIAALAGGIIWSVFDGINGAIKAGKFGGTKISGFIAGFLGGTGSGWKNAFKNAGKLALIGAGGGFLIGGPVGAIIGGLIGAAVGGVMGFIGHEKLTKGFDKIGKFLYKNIFEGIGKFFIGLKDSILDPFKKKDKNGIKKSSEEINKSLAFKVGASIRSLIKFVSKEVVDTFKSKGKYGKKGAMIGFAIGSVPGALLGGIVGLVVEGVSLFINKIPSFLGSIGNVMVDFLNGLTDGKFSELIENLKEMNPIGKIKDFFIGIKTNITDKIELTKNKLAEIDPIGKIKDFVIDMKNKVVSFVTFIGDFFGFLQEGFKAKNILSFIGTIAKGEFGDQFSEFREKKQQERGIVDDSFAIMNDEMKKANQIKSEVDQQMLNELKKLNQKKEEKSNVVQNNIVENTFNPNIIRGTLSYQKGSL